MNDYQKYDDENLVAKYYQTQDNYWLGVVLQRYTILLLGVCMKYLHNEDDAKDAVQQVFYKVLNEASHSKIQSFRAWLYTIAKNHCLMILRSGKNRVIEEWSENLMESLQEEIPQDIAEKEMLYNNMNVALNKLNDEQKKCISLFYLNKKSYSEIAGITGFDDMQVKSHIQNGKRNLKILIQKMQQKNG